MALDIVKISNIFNVLAQEYGEVQFYHFGWRSDIERNISNNFDIGQETGRLFPAIHLVPQRAQWTDKSSDTTIYTFRIYFDDLAHYNNNSSSVDSVENTIVQWRDLEDIARNYLAEIDRWGRVYKNEGSVFYIQEMKRTEQIVFEYDEFVHKDRLISIYTTINVVVQGECPTPLNIDPRTRGDWPVQSDDYEARTVSAVSGWDTDNDDQIDNNAIAEYLGNGAFQSYQFLKDTNDTVLTSGNITLQVSAQYPYSNLPYQILGTFNGTIGSRLDISMGCDDSLNLSNYFGTGNTAGHGNQMQFDKELFALDTGSININAQILIFTLLFANDNLSTSNPNTTLTIPTQQIEGTFSSPFDIAISRQTDEPDQKIYLATSGSVSDISQLFLNRFYSSREFANTNGITRVSRIKLDTSINPLGDLYYMEFVSFKFARGIGLNADGHTIFDTPEEIAFGYFSVGRNIAYLNEDFNGRKLTIGTGFGGIGVNARVYEYSGTPGNYNEYNLVGGVFSQAPQIISTTGYIYVVDNDLYLTNFSNFTTVMRGITKLSYTTDPRITSNWSRVDINIDFLTSPSLGGVAGIRGCCVDSSTGEIYIANGGNHCIQKITPLIPNPSGPSDYLTEVFAGQVGVDGFDNGPVSTATFTNPVSLEILDRKLYVVGGVGANDVRVIDLDTEIVSNFKGQSGVAGNTESIEF